MGMNQIVMRNRTVLRTRRSTCFAPNDRGAACSRGFTAVELLIVLAIIGMMIGLLLPAIQAAREAARRTDCSTRLSQLQLAVAGYHSTHGVLPPGTFSSALPVANYPNGYHHGWLVRILPWLGRSVIYRNVDFSRSVYRPVNQFLFAEPLEPLTCPSNPMWGQPRSDFAAVYDGRPLPITADSRGPFVANRGLTVDDVSDGFSRTLFASEKLSGTWDLGWPSGTTATLRTTGIPLAESNSRAARTIAIQGTAGTSDPYGWFLPLESGAGDPEAEEHPSASAGLAPEQQSMQSIRSSRLVLVNAAAEELEMYSSLVAPPLAPSASVPAAAPKNQWYVPAGFASYHQGGVNAVMLDGSVKFLTNSIDARLFASLGIRDDAAPLSDLP